MAAISAKRELKVVDEINEINVIALLGAVMGTQVEAKRSSLKPIKELHEDRRLQHFDRNYPSAHTMVVAYQVLEDYVPPQHQEAFQQFKRIYTDEWLEGVREKRRQQEMVYRQWEKSMELIRTHKALDESFMTQVPETIREAIHHIQQWNPVEPEKSDNDKISDAKSKRIMRTVPISVQARRYGKVIMRKPKPKPY